MARGRSCARRYRGRSGASSLRGRSGKRRVWVSCGMLRGWGKNWRHRPCFVCVATAIARLLHAPERNQQRRGENEQEDEREKRVVEGQDRGLRLHCPLHHGKRDRQRLARVLTIGDE